jgi:hypothetical protein
MSHHHVVIEQDVQRSAEDIQKNNTKKKSLVGTSAIR